MCVINFMKCKEKLFVYRITFLDIVDFFLYSYMFVHSHRQVVIFAGVIFHAYARWNFSMLSEELDLEILY